MGKPTPGPWRYEATFPYEESPSQPYARIESGRGFFEDGAGGFELTGIASEADAALIAAAPEFRDLAEAVLLFHAGGEWDDARCRRWHELTGATEATTHALCDFARHVLSRARVQP